MGSFCIQCVSVVTRLESQIIPDLATDIPSDGTPIPGYVLILWHKMLQAHLDLFLPPAWNQPFLQTTFGGLFNLSYYCYLKNLYTVPLAFLVLSFRIFSTCIS